jgi:hypothetical protein
MKIGWDIRTVNLQNIEWSPQGSIKMALLLIGLKVVAFK